MSRVLDAGEPLIIELVVLTSSYRHTRRTPDASTVYMWLADEALEARDFREIYIHKIANYRRIHIIRKYVFLSHFSCSRS